MKPKNPLLSRKLWTAVIAALAVFLSQYVGIELDTQTMLGIILPIIAYIAGEALVDAKRAGAQQDPEVQLARDIGALYVRWKNHEITREIALQQATALVSAYNAVSQRPAPDFLLQPLRGE